MRLLRKPSRSELVSKSGDVVKRGTLRLMSSATRGLLRARTWKLRHCEVEIGAIDAHGADVGPTLKSFNSLGKRLCAGSISLENCRATAVPALDGPDRFVFEIISGAHAARELVAMSDEERSEWLALIAVVSAHAHRTHDEQLRAIADLQARALAETDAAVDPSDAAGQSTLRTDSAAVARGEGEGEGAGDGEGSSDDDAGFAAKDELCASLSGDRAGLSCLMLKRPGAANFITSSKRWTCRYCHLVDETIDEDGMDVGPAIVCLDARSRAKDVVLLEGCNIIFKPRPDRPGRFFFDVYNPLDHSLREFYASAPEERHRWVRAISWTINATDERSHDARDSNYWSGHDDDPRHNQGEEEEDQSDFDDQQEDDDS